MALSSFPIQLRYLHLRSTFTVFTFVRLFQIRTKTCWNLRLTSFTRVRRVPRFTAPFTYTHSLLQEQLLCSCSLEWKTQRPSTSNSLQLSKLLLGPAFLVHVIHKIIWVTVIYPARVHMERWIYENCPAKVAKITKQCRRRLKEYCKEYENILVCGEALPQTIFLLLHHLL